MRHAILLCALALLPCAGCSAMVASSGKDLNYLTTRDEVHKEFGKPKESGTADGNSYEEFRSHQMIAEPGGAIGMTMVNFATLGLAEFVLFPAELYKVSSRSITGQSIRFSYDESGNVVGASINGEPIAWSPHRDLIPESEQMKKGKSKVARDASGLPTMGPPDF